MKSGADVRLYVIAALALLLAPGAAHAEWLPIGTSTSNAVYLADPLRIRTVGKFREIWIKIDHSRDASVSYRSAMNLFSVDCAARSFKTLSISRYDSYGKVVFSQSYPNYSSYGYTPVTPETMMEAVAEAACLGQ